MSISSSRRRLAALSSTTRTRRSRRSTASGAPRPRRVVHRRETRGEMKGAALAGLTLHPDAPAHQLDERDEIVRPSPVPPYLRVVEPSA